MAGGLQVWDNGGALIFNETTPVVKFLGSVTIGANYTGAGHENAVVDARFTQFAQHVGFWCRIDGLFSVEGSDATWRFDGNSLIWTYPEVAPRYINGALINRPQQTIVYGIR